MVAIKNILFKTIGIVGILVLAFFALVKSSLRQKFRYSFK